MADTSAQIAELEADIRMLQGQPNSATDPDLLDAIAWRQDQLAALRGDGEGEGGSGDAGMGGGGTLGEEDIRDMFDYYANFGRSTAQGTLETMDSFMFMKFAKECPGLLGGGLTRTEVDLVFTKAKPKGERRLAFEHFLDALSAFSEKKYPAAEPAEALQALISNHLVPQFEMVQLEMAKTGETEVPVTGVFKRLYDVRNYTGVYAERFRSGDGRINSHADNRVGRQYKGNTNTGTDEVIHNIASIMRPNLRSTGSTMPKSRKGKRGASGSSTPSSAKSKTRTRRGNKTPSRHSASPSHRGLGTPRSLGGGMGSSRSFMARTTSSASMASSYQHPPSPSPSGAHSGAVSSLLAGNDTELVHALAAARSGNAEALCSLAVDLAAEARRMSADNARLRQQLQQRGSNGTGSPAPPRQPTRAAPPPPPTDSRRGGGASAGAAPPAVPASPGPARDATPRSSSNDATAKLAALKRQVDELMDRLSYMPDGSTASKELLEQLRDTERQYEAALAESIGAPAPHSASDVSGGGSGGSGRDRLARDPMGGSSASLALPPDAPPMPETLREDHLKDIFSWYCNFGRSAAQSRADTMDSFMFMKFAKECPNLLGPSVTRTDVDLIFTKAKPKFERRLDFRCFLDALSALSEKRYADAEPADGLRRLLTDHLAPLWSMVQMERSKTGETEIPVTGVFQRLYDVRNYTGVYAERFRSGDGRINSHADNRVGRSFQGNTNTGTDEVIHNISSIMRPNLRSTGSTMPKNKR